MKTPFEEETKTSLLKIRRVFLISTPKKHDIKATYNM